MTRIIFDTNGKPYWYKVPQSGAYLHSLPDLQRASEGDRDVPFTPEDLDWFRKPWRVQDDA